jgi:N-acetylneuraminate synthase
VRYGILEAEENSLTFKRSIYVIEDMEEGEIFNSTNTRIIRPGLGLAPKFIDTVIGKKINRAVKKGTALTWNLIG